MSITFKAHGGYDAPWFVVPDQLGTDLSSAVEHAAWQKQYLIAAFGLGAVEGIQDMTLHQVAVIAEPIWGGSSTVAKLLGGTPVVEETTQGGSLAGKAKPAAKAEDVQVQQEAPAAPQPAADHGPMPDATPEPAAPENPFQGVLDDIAAATTKKDLQKIFMANKKAFEDKAVADAAAAKGKGLTS